MGTGLSGDEVEYLASCGEGIGGVVMEEIKVKNLIKNYLIDGNKKNTIRVLRGLDITVEQGEFIAVMGKSGCGKTTLLKILGLIDQPTAGEILFMGKIRKNCIRMNWRISAETGSDSFSGFLPDGQYLGGREYYAADDTRKEEI